MYTIAKAITWEFYRENRWWWICLATAIAAIGILGAIHEGANDTTKAIDALSLFIILIPESMLVSYLLQIKQHNPQTERIGFPTHLFTKPVPTWALVLGRLSLALIATIAMQGLVTLTFRLSSNTYVPFVKSTLLVVLTIAWAHAFTWLFNGVHWLQIIGSFVSILPLFALLSLWANHRGDISAVQLLSRIPLWILFTGLAGAYLVAWIGVTLDRRGMSLNPNRLLALLPTSKCETTRHYLPHSAFWTLYRFEMRRTAWPWPLTNAMGFLVLLTFWLSKRWPTDSFGGFLFLGGLLNVTAVPILIGVVCGQHSRSRLIMESYKAVKPVTNRTFLRVYLLTALSSLALAWIVFLLGSMIISFGLLITEKMEVLEKLLHLNLGNPPTGLYPGLPRIIGVLVTVWTILTLSGTVMLAGRRWLAITVWLGIWIIPALLGMVGEGLPQTVYPVYTTILSFIWIILCGGGTLAAFALAWKRKHLGLPAITGSLVAYLLLILLLDRAPGPEPDTLFLFTLGAVLTLPVLPITAAPLAIAWNRHR